MDYPDRAELEGYLDEVEEERGKLIQPWIRDVLINEHHVSTAMEEKNPLRYLLQIVAAMEQVAAARSKKRADTQPRTIAPDRNLQALNHIVVDAARRDRELAVFRRKVLRGRAIKPGRVGSWIAKKQKDQGKPTTWVTTRADAEHVPSFREELPSLDGGSFSTNLLEYDIGDGNIYVVPVAAGKPLGLLYDLVHLLCPKYGWAQAETVRFVLTDEPPQPTLITARVTPEYLLPARSKILMSISPRATPDEVKSLYASIREKQTDTPKRSKPISEKHAELAVFVASNTSGRTWVAVMEAWNREHPDPDWQYEDMKPFNRDARRAFLRVTGTRLNWEGEK